MASRSAPVNPFTKASAVEPNVKALIYGAWGAGKTYFALGAPGKVAVIDTEGGTAFYAGAFPDYDVITTKSYRDVIGAIDFIERTPGEYRTLVIDPVTILYDTLQEAALKARVVKAARKAERGPAAARADFDPDNVDLEMLDWGRIKRNYKALMTRLVNLPVHVIVTAREKEEREKRGDEMVLVGHRPDAEKGTAYNFDVVLRALKRGDRREFVVEKARGLIGEHLPLGSKHTDPTFTSLFGEALKIKPAKKGAARTVADDEAASNADAEAFGEKLAGPILAGELHAALEAAGYDPETVRENRNWPPFAELPEQTARDALAKLTAKGEAAKADSNGTEAQAAVDAAADAEPVEEAS